MKSSVPILVSLIHTNSFIHPFFILWPSYSMALAGPPGSHENRAAKEAVFTQVPRERLSEKGGERSSLESLSVVEHPRKLHGKAPFSGSGALFDNTSKSLFRQSQKVGSRKLRLLHPASNPPLVGEVLLAYKVRSR